ncbi:AraC family transcriptional regulator [Niallia hominis]|uniref:GyrI-like domain-containing protein n=1 Tax=Niallia hominis TaxID=3133173 RepID=A0ABV1F332_9BACI
MTWLEGLQKALNYIEKNLEEKLEIEEIARVANVSAFHFQRTFAILTEIPVGEYIRRRRLSIAGQSLLQSKEKIIDIAFKYGYETPEAFTKAYRRQHGITPSETRRGIGSLKIYNPLVIQVQLKGAEPMKVKVVDKEEFTIVGMKKSYSFQEDENLREIPKLWEEVNKNGTVNELLMLSVGEVPGVLGVCVDQSEASGKNMDYWIAVATEEKSAKYDQLIIPASKWAVFEVHGPMPHSMQKVWKQIYSEWMPTSTYQQAGYISFERYTDDDPSSDNCYSEIWIPVK